MAPAEVPVPLAEAPVALAARSRQTSPVCCVPEHEGADGDG